MNEHEKLALAKRHVAAMKFFYVHLLVFVLVMALLLAINAATRTIWWAQWPFLAWGVLVAAHALAVFRAPKAAGAKSPGMVARWEQRKQNEYKQRLDKADGKAPESPTA